MAKAETHSLTMDLCLDRSEQGIVDWTNAVSFSWRRFADHTPGRLRKSWLSPSSNYKEFNDTLLVWEHVACRKFISYYVCHCFFLQTNTLLGGRLWISPPLDVLSLESVTHNDHQLSHGTASSALPVSDFSDGSQRKGNKWQFTPLCTWNDKDFHQWYLVFGMIQAVKINEGNSNGTIESYTW